MQHNSDLRNAVVRGWTNRLIFPPATDLMECFFFLPLFLKAVAPSPSLGFTRKEATQVVNVQNAAPKTHGPEVSLQLEADFGLV